MQALVMFFKYNYIYIYIYIYRALNLHRVATAVWCACPLGKQRQPYNWKNIKNIIKKLINHM